MNGSALLEILNFKYSHLICIFDILKLKISICLLSHIVPNVHFIKSEFANLHFVIIPLILNECYSNNVCNGFRFQGQNPVLMCNKHSFVSRVTLYQYI